MANFTSNIDLDKIIPQGLQDDGLALDMVSAGLDVMQSAIERGAERHVRTGAMVRSVKSGKPYINNEGSAVGKVNISGKDKTGTSNALKAMFIEFGTKNYPAQPFVRPAIQSSQSSINAAMEKVFESKVNSST